LLEIEKNKNQYELWLMRYQISDKLTSPYYFRFFWLVRKVQIIFFLIKWPQDSSQDSSTYKEGLWCFYIKSLFRSNPQQYWSLTDVLPIKWPKYLLLIDPLYNFMHRPFPWRFVSNVWQIKFFLPENFENPFMNVIFR
jgi:hypothetical protein